MKKLFILCAALLMCLCAFAGCTVVPDESVAKYNAVLYDDAEEWIDEEFLKENKVKTNYTNENYVEGASDGVAKYIYSETSPKTREILINDLEEFERICITNELTVDFDKEMLVLYIFSRCYSRPYFLKNITVNEQKLIITINIKESILNDMSMPTASCILVKMDKIDITDVEFIRND